ncbi:hypothetical protein HRR75_006318 [Exophiala dermatitidis]|nr:hypothetical protein HRR75_006318 [Exophiala dermatitidis]
MPSATSPPTLASHPDIPPFPSPSTFSILPDIYLLIARLNILHLNPPSTSTSDPTQSQTQTQAQSQSQSQTQLSATSNVVGAQTQTQQESSSNQTAPPHHLLTDTPLDLKDLPAQIYPIKQKLVKARAAVTALPDIERTVEEQEQEIRDLERTVGLLRKRLGPSHQNADAVIDKDGGDGDGNMDVDLDVDVVKEEAVESDTVMQGVEG